MLSSQKQIESSKISDDEVQTVMSPHAQGKANHANATKGYKRGVITRFESKADTKNSGSMACACGIKTSSDWCDEMTEAMSDCAGHKF